MTTGTNLATRPPQTVGELVRSDYVKSQIAAALPRHITPEMFMRVATTSIAANPMLKQCDVASLVRQLLTCAQLGLVPDGIRGQAYLIPFRNRKKNIVEVQLIPGYRGLMDLARRSGEVIRIESRVVRDGDHFEFEYGLNPTLIHKPTQAGGGGKLLAVYAIGWLKDGSSQFDMMWKADVDKIRERSRASGAGPWVTDYDAMAQKTVTRRLCKWLPSSSELAQAIALDERNEAGLDTSFIDVDPAGDPEPEKPQAPSLDDVVDGEPAADVRPDPAPENKTKPKTSSKSAPKGELARVKASIIEVAGQVPNDKLNEAIAYEDFEDMAEVSQSAALGPLTRLLAALKAAAKAAPEQQTLGDVAKPAARVEA